MNSLRRRWLVAIASIGCFGWCVSYAQTNIHVFGVFCNSYQGQGGAINESVTADQWLITGMFRDHVPEQGWGVRVHMTILSEGKATKANLQNQFERFVGQVREEDTVFVYFSGHGVILDRQAGVQFLQTVDSQLVNREDWARQMAALKCRLKILITDCCSSYPAGQLAEGDADVEPWETLYYLFLRHEGFVNISAASPGQYAYGTSVGGYLTVNLESDMQRFRTWREVFQATQARVFQESEEDARNSGDPGRTAQRPFAYSLGKPLFNAGNDSLPEAVAYVIPDSHHRKLARAELQNLGLQQLYFARNEIYARHGYDFRTPLLQNYFASRPWYRCIAGFKSPQLSQVEQQNVHLILDVEKAAGGPFVASASASLPSSANRAAPDIFPYSSHATVPRSVVQTLSLKELSLARNEIYARHGYPFQNAIMRAYFGAKPYYRRNERATDPPLNAVERHNVWLIKKIERLKGGPFQW